MDIVDLELNTEHELIKSHSCSGRMERHYSEMLEDRFQDYQDFLCNVFEVGDISFVNVWKKRFGFLTEGSEFYDLLLSNEKFSQELNTPEISFVGHVCVHEGIVYVVAVWKLFNDSNNRVVIYLKKKDELII